MDVKKKKPKSNNCFAEDEEMDTCCGNTLESIHLIQCNLTKYSMGVHIIVRFFSAPFFDKGQLIPYRHREKDLGEGGLSKWFSSKKHCCMTGGLLNQEKRTYNQYLIGCTFISKTFLLSIMSQWPPKISRNKLLFWISCIFKDV